MEQGQTEFMKHLPNIQAPADVKKLTPEQLLELVTELRQEILSVVSETGGHLATNMGSVELTVALHYVFDLPKDKLIWDVSNQIYAHINADRPPRADVDLAPIQWPVRIRQA
jgi:1-deoxy-D-xylulose-5-phosphate synthase